MLTIKLEFENQTEDLVNFRTYLLGNTWMGAFDRVKAMSEEETKELLNYLSEIGTTMTDIQLNDFIWFQWEDIKNELPF